MPRTVHPSAKPAIHNPASHPKAALSPATPADARTAQAPARTSPVMPIALANLFSFLLLFEQTATSLTDVFTSL